MITVMVGGRPILTLVPVRAAYPCKPLSFIYNRAPCDPRGRALQRIETSLPGVCLIRSDVHSDQRGFFLESYHRDKFAKISIRDTFVQDNHSKSAKNTLRGLHYQLSFPQAKLCRVVQGEVLDVDRKSTRLNSSHVSI